MKHTRVKLSIETTPGAPGKLAESRIEIAGSRAAVLEAWSLLTYSLSETIGIPVSAILAFGVVSAKDTRDAVVDRTNMDITGMRRQAGI